LTPARCAHAPARRHITHHRRGPMGIAPFSRVRERARSARRASGATDGRAAHAHSGSAPATKSPWRGAPALSSIFRNAVLTVRRPFTASGQLHILHARNVARHQLCRARAPLRTGRRCEENPSWPAHASVLRGGACTETRHLKRPRMAQISAESWTGNGSVLTSLRLSGKLRHSPCAQCAVWWCPVLLA